MAYTYDFDAWGALISIKDNQGHTISGNSTSLATTNPLRYRGYVYDDETGLYYLQSRYYDPKTGRFLNADVYLDTASGSPLSANMFAYSENCWTFKVDINGKDAAWIQSPDSAEFLWRKNGHTSILIQEKPNWWWYFYWSGESVHMIFLPASNLKQLNQRINRTLRVLSILYDKKINYKDTYKKMLLFKGNFTSAIRAIRNKFEVVRRTSKMGYYSLTFNPAIKQEDYNKMIKNKTTIKNSLKTKTHRYHGNKARPSSLFLFGKNSKYNLFSYNCMDISAEMLAYGTLSKKNSRVAFKEDLYYIKNKYIVPNDAYRCMRGLNYHFKESFL